MGGSEVQDLLHSRVECTTAELKLSRIGNRFLPAIILSVPDEQSVAAANACVQHRNLGPTRIPVPDTNYRSPGSGMNQIDPVSIEGVTGRLNRSEDTRYRYRPGSSPRIRRHRLEIPIELGTLAIEEDEKDANRVNSPPIRILWLDLEGDANDPCIPVLGVASADRMRDRCDRGDTMIIDLPGLGVRGGPPWGRLRRGSSVERGTSRTARDENRC